MNFVTVESNNLEVIVLRPSCESSMRLFLQTALEWLDFTPLIFYNEQLPQISQPHLFLEFIKW